MTSVSPSNPAAPDVPPLDPLRWKTLVLICVAFVVVILDNSVTNVALPDIQRGLGFSPENLQWVINAYVLAFAGLLLLGGRAADLFGAKRLFVAGLGVFTAASLACGLADTQAWLVIARGVQGIGAAVMTPAALAVLALTFVDDAERTKALGIFGGLGALAGALGVVVGGALTEAFGWEWIFLINVPIGVVALALVPRLIHVPNLTHRGTFDVGGALAVTAGLVLLCYAIVNGEDAGFGSVETLVLFAGSAALLLAFVGIERALRAPLVPLRVFGVGTVAKTNTLMIVATAAAYSLLLILSLYMQQVLGYSALEAGFAFCGFSITLLAGIGLVTALLPRVGPGPIFVAGQVILAGALLLMAGMPADGSYWSDVLPAMLVAGAGFSLSSMPVFVTGSAALPPQEAGLAGGLINTSQQVGAAIGVALLATLAASRTEDAVAQGTPAGPVALLEGFQLAFTVGAGISAVGAVLGLLLLGTRRAQPVPTPATTAA